ncbi:hypothetical protein H8S90_06765 [Olivibacter sp. SDN3]|uniref:hypothetical protein n=1 Tax=Olivibacter sp. SDN3 TaxID=2764720 RepID=UPI001651AF38|nr:hypothetical protein [Olivibacter sp. SDN3]QNL51271.1 hypothetical protein H8S90_06765 [Olivibacter sp. SDN3]
MAHLNTTDPVVLGYLMDDLIYTFQTNETSNVPSIDTISNKPITGYTFLGENKQHILYLIEDQQYEYFSEKALDAFSKTVQALNLSMVDVAVMNVARQSTEITFEKIVHFFNPQKIIFSGPSPDQYGLPQLPLNQAAKEKNIHMLYTYTFEEMLQEINKKKTFWMQVKNL